jgi:hypothetical protein
MSFLKTPIVRFVAWSLTLALLANGPMLSAEQRVTAAQSNENSGPEPLIQDVRLQAGGILMARIVNAQGNPVSGEQVSILFQGKEVAAVVSDADGFATVSGLRPGLHAIATPTGMSACRLWNAETAPPASASVPAVVSDAQVIRGQFGAFNLPMVVVLAAAAAGVVLAIDAQNTASDAEDANAALAARVRALETASP